MSSYVTVTRSHDAEWLLGQEQRYNDALLVAGQNRPKRTRKASDHDKNVLLRLVPYGPGELATAERVVQEITGRLGLDDTAVAEVLDMLGLTEVTQ